MKKLSIALLVLSLAACGGGGTETTTTTAPTVTPPPAPVMPAGLWVGTVTANNVNYEALGIITPSGKARFISDDGEQESAILTLDGSKFTGVALGFDAQGNKIGDGTLTADFTETTITGEASAGGSQTSTFSFTKSANSAEGASFATIKGNYVNSDQTAAIAIDIDGQMSGSDNLGCQYLGNITIPDATLNIYEFTLDVSSCGNYSGSYNGLATYTKPYTNSASKQFVFQGDNGNYALTDYLTKQ